PGERNGSESISLFRYQSAEGMIRMIRKYTDSKKKSKRKPGPEQSGMTGIEKNAEPEHSSEKRGAVRIRDEPMVRGMIGIYSPVHRIGKTKFALRLGQKLARQIPVLYLNLEGYSGGAHYFQEGADKDLGDLLYFLKQER